MMSNETMFDEQLRNDIARVIAEKGAIKRHGRNIVGFTCYEHDYVPDVFATWHIYRGTATRKVVKDDPDGSYTKTETVYPNVQIWNASDFMKLVKRILNPIQEETPDLSDIPF